MIKYEDVIREIAILSKQKKKNEMRIQELNEQNNSIMSSLKILNTKKEVFEKLDSDLDSVMRKKKKKEKNTNKLVMQSEDCDGNKAEQNVASNVFWPQNDRKR